MCEGVAHETKVEVCPCAPTWQVREKWRVELIDCRCNMAVRDSTQGELVRKKRGRGEVMKLMAAPVKSHHCGVFCACTVASSLGSQSWNCLSSSLSASSTTKNLREGDKGRGRKGEETGGLSASQPHPLVTTLLWPEAS